MMYTTWGENVNINNLLHIQFRADPEKFKRCLILGLEQRQHSKHSKVCQPTEATFEGNIRRFGTFEGNIRRFGTFEGLSTYGE